MRTVPADAQVSATAPDRGSRERGITLDHPTGEVAPEDAGEDGVREATLHADDVTGVDGGGLDANPDLVRSQVEGAGPREASGSPGTRAR